MSLETLAATASLTALNHTTPTKPLLTNPTDSTERQYTGFLQPNSKHCKNLPLPKPPSASSLVFNAGKSRLQAENSCLVRSVSENLYTRTPSILADLSEVNEDLIDPKETPCDRLRVYIPEPRPKKKNYKSESSRQRKAVLIPLYDSADTVVDITPPQLVLPKLTCIEHDSVFNSASSSNNIVPVSDKSSNQSLSPLEVKTIQLKIEPDTKITCITDLSESNNKPFESLDLDPKTIIANSKMQRKIAYSISKWKLLATGLLPQASAEKVNSNTVSPQSSVTEESRPFKTASKLQSCIVSNDGPSKAMTHSSTVFHTIEQRIHNRRSLEMIHFEDSKSDHSLDSSNSDASVSRPSFSTGSYAEKSGSGDTIPRDSVGLLKLESENTTMVDPSVSTPSLYSAISVPRRRFRVFGATSSVSRPQTSSLDLKAAAQHRYKITAKPKPSATIGIGFKDYDEINREWLQMIEEPIVTIKKPQTKKSRAITFDPKVSALEFSQETPVINLYDLEDRCVESDTDDQDEMGSDTDPIAQSILPSPQPLIQVSSTSDLLKKAEQAWILWTSNENLANIDYIPSQRDYDDMTDEERSIPNGIYITLVRTAVRDTSSPATRGLLIPKHLGEFRTGAVRIKGMDIGNGGKHMSKESLTQSLPLVVGYKASGQSMPAIGVALEDQPNYDAHRTESSLWVSTNALLSQFALPPSHSYHTHMQSSRAELPSTVDTTHLPTVATHSGPISNCTSLVQAIGTTTEWVAGSIARLTTKKTTKPQTRADSTSGIVMTQPNL
ncbi:hypothetical protein QVD99_007755 [Batrachochytrium dendrobatidis]|nr:hypothetical protein O5D80_001410 [Batrachochytrium dendrobatidis]KAK5665403.1 hypothetical protein QVD99_007755 [Batrachochytrium dendrobatidis]